MGDWNSSRSEKVRVGAANVKNRNLISQAISSTPTPGSLEKGDCLFQGEPQPSPAAGFALRGRGLSNCKHALGSQRDEVLDEADDEVFLRGQAFGDKQGEGDEGVVVDELFDRFGEQVLV